MNPFPEIQVGEPIRHGVLTVFPLFGEELESVDYRLAGEAIDGGEILVKEIDEKGSVPELMVENRSDMPVLFIEGEELAGAKQNRILNTSVLIAAHSQTVIPVSCVEEGRWRTRTPHFGVSGRHASPHLRHRLKKSVGDSLASGSGHQSDQGEVWDEVGRQMRSLGSRSPTGAMADTYQNYTRQLGEYKERLAPVDSARGLVAALGEKIVSMDLFDRASTCRSVWPRLLTGLIMSALEVKDGDARADAETVEKLWRSVRSREWSPVSTVGLGEELRSKGDEDECGAALVVEGTLLHGSVTVV